MKFKAFFRQKAVYLVLLACVFAVAFSSFWALRGAVRGMQPAPEKQEEKTWTQPKTQASNEEEDIPILPEAAPESAASSAASSELPDSSAASQPADASADVPTEPAEPSEPAAASYTWPVTGEPVQAFSGQELLYNETLKDWRTHNGLDLSCPEGTEVQAAAAGEITAVYEDALWGWVAEEESGKDLYRYCGLAAKPEVKAGDTVATGDRLGTVGTVEAEQTLGSHLHFEVLRGGEYLDPQKLYG